jgi:tetratricopeptide (TPR) repeat protein
MSSLGELLAVGEVKQAVELARERLARNPGDAEALLALARVAVTEDQGARASSLIQQAVAHGADPREVTLVRAALAFQGGHWEAARSLYLPFAAEERPPPEALYGLGVALLRTGEVDAGREALELAVTSGPEVPSMRFELGRAYAMSGRLRPAVRQFVSCLRLNAADERAWRFLAELLAEQGRKQMARRLLKRGLECAPGSALLRKPLPRSAPTPDEDYS